MTLKVLLVFVAIAVVAVLVRFASVKKPPAAGSMAPNFRLDSQEGKPVSLQDFRGQWVILYFYPKDMTSGCTIEARQFQRDLAKFAEKNAVVLGVSVDGIDSHKQFCTKEGLSFRLLADPGGAVSREYGSLTDLIVVRFAARNTFLIDPQGKIVETYAGNDASKHSPQMLAALDRWKSAEGTPH